jgi:hypothetical protein
MTQKSEGAYTFHSPLTAKQRLCRLSIISDLGPCVTDRLVDTSMLEMLQPGVMPFSLMTMPLGGGYRVSLVVDKQKDNCASEVTDVRSS